MRYLGSIRRADGTTDDITFEVESTVRFAGTHRERRHRRALDFRTATGTPIVVGAGDRLSVPLPDEPPAEESIAL